MDPTGCVMDDVRHYVWTAQPGDRLDCRVVLPDKQAQFVVASDQGFLDISITSNMTAGRLMLEPEEFEQQWQGYLPGAARPFRGQWVVVQALGVRSYFKMRESTGRRSSVVCVLRPHVRVKRIKGTADVRR